MHIHGLSHGVLEVKSPKSKINSHTWPQPWLLEQKNQIPENEFTYMAPAMAEAMYVNCFSGFWFFLVQNAMAEAMYVNEFSGLWVCQLSRLWVPSPIILIIADSGIS